MPARLKKPRTSVLLSGRGYNRDRIPWIKSAFPPCDGCLTALWLMTISFMVRCAFLPTPTIAEGGERYPEGESNLLFDWSMLVDTVALGLSYAWLCCGVIVLLGLTGLFVTLWAASKRREQAEE